MSERPNPYEREQKKSLGDQIQAIFERRATKGERNLILETYRTKLDTLIQKLPAEERGNVAVKIQKVITTIRGVFVEYGARITDFIRKVFLWPMIRADKDFPKDKYYQIELARAKAWGEFAKDSSKTATAERTAYRDHFLSTAVSHAQAVGASVGLSAAAWGAFEGAKIGTVVGLGVQGAVGGAIVGGVGGGIYSAGLYLKDKIMGPPTAYYDLFWGSGRRGVIITNPPKGAVRAPAQIIGGSA